MQKGSIKQLTIASLLIAMGILIPMVMPRITIGPASFTLVSHVPVFLAMFFSPWMALVVSLGTGLGFFLSATPIIGMRALSHILFAVVGAWLLQKYPQLVNAKKQQKIGNGSFFIFNLFIALVHTVVELTVVIIFYTMGNLPETYYQEGFLYSILLLMGVGGVIHSIVDFSIAYFIAQRLSQRVMIPVFVKSKEHIDSLNEEHISEVL